MFRYLMLALFLLASKLYFDLSKEPALSVRSECIGRLSGYIPCINLVKKSKGDSNYFEKLTDFELGMLYEMGLDVEKDFPLSHRYYKKASSNGNEVASFLVGLNYLDGVGVKKSINSALEWFLISSEKNHPKAMYNASSIIIHNKFESYYKQALKLLLALESKGYVNSYYLLFKIYYQGIGVSQNSSKALSYLNKCYKEKDPGCTTQLAYFYLKGKGGLDDKVLGMKLMKESESLGCKYASEFIAIQEFMTIYGGEDE